MKYLYITLLIFLTLQCNRPKIEEYEYEKYGKVTGDVTLRESYTKESERIKTITKGSIILLTAKIEKTLKTGEVVIWYKARSYSGEEGYVFGDFVTLISLDIAKKELLRKRNQFEIYLKNLIIIATSERIKSSNQFPYDILTDIQIITPLEETSSSSYNVQTTSWMKGALLQLDTTQVVSTVNLFIDIDYDNLDHSIIRVNHTDLNSFQKLEGIDPNKAIDLLSKIL